MADEFKDFQYFASWCQQQVGYNNWDYVLEKDLLGGDIKMYAPDNCVFVPTLLNNILMRNDSKRGDYLLGVSPLSKSKKFMARLKLYGRVKYLGAYDTPEEAYTVYKVAKEQYVKVVAEQYKDDIDCRVYELLSNFKLPGRVL